MAQLWIQMDIMNPDQKSGNYPDLFVSLYSCICIGRVNETVSQCYVLKTVVAV